MAAKRQPRIRTIKGIIIPDQWDENGQVTRVSVQTTDEEEYVLEPDTREDEVFSLIHEKVQVTGRVKKSADGKKSIRIESCQKIVAYGDP